MATDGRMFWRLILKLTISIDKMIAHAIFFYTFSIIAVVSAIMVTASKNTVHSVFFLILDFISISCLFIMIGAEFLGMIMLIVYVGAVAVLFLFVVMMLNVAQQKNQWFLSKTSSSHIPIGLIISAIIGVVLILIILFQKTEGGSLGLGTQTSLTGGMTANKSSFSGMTKITYVLGFGFLFWCLFMGAIITKQYSSSTDLETIQEEIILDDSIEEMIPEVPNQ